MNNMDFKHKQDCSNVTKPGSVPTDAKCQSCRGFVSHEHAAVTCIKCSRWTHRKCCISAYDISLASYVLADKGSLQIFYVCSNCPQPRRPRSHTAPKGLRANRQTQR